MQFAWHSNQSRGSVFLILINLYSKLCTKSISRNFLSISACTWMRQKFYDFVIFIFLLLRDLQMITRKILTNLKNFVEDKISEIPQSSSCYYQIIRSPKSLNIHLQSPLKCLKFDKYYDFVISNFLLWEIPRWSPEIFWQISNYLSRKNIWYPTEHLVLLPNHQKSQIIEYTPVIVNRMLETAQNNMILWFSFFCYERLLDDLKKTFNKSQIICW